MPNVVNTNGTNITYPDSVTANGQFNVDAYLQARPDLVSSYNANPGPYGSLQNFALADAAANGGPAITSLISAGNVATPPGVALSKDGNGVPTFGSQPKAGTGATNPIGAANPFAGSPGSSVEPAGSGPVASQPLNNSNGSTLAQSIFGGNSGNDLSSTLGGVVAGAGTGNTSQVQVGGQTGAYNSAGTTNTTGAQNQTQNTSNTTGTTQQQSGNTSGVQTGATSNLGATSQNTGTSGTTKVNDSLGFGSLLQGQQGAATQNTATDQSFLSNLVKNGPQQQQALTAQATNQALSGPGMVGAGDNAGARAAGYAASNVGLNSLNQQLQGAAQLAGPSATTTLASAANPYLGTSTTGNTSSTGTNANTGSSTQDSATTTNQSLASLAQSTGLSNLLNNTSTSTNEAQSGTAGGTSLSVGAGNAPQATTTSSGGGGCYACTALIHLGMMHRIALLRGGDYKFGNVKYRKSLAGYSIYGPWLARQILKHSWFAKLFRPIARVILYQEVRLSGREIPFRLDAWIWHFLFDKGSWVLAFACRRDKCITTDPKIEKLLRSHSVFWEVK